VPNKKAAPAKKPKQPQKNQYHLQLRTSLNIMGLLALEIVRKLEPTVKERLLESEERQNLALAKDILCSVQKLKLDAKRVKNTFRMGENAEESLQTLPAITEDLKKMALRLVAAEGAHVKGVKGAKEAADG
jgi:hypothetical protein